MTISGREWSGRGVRSGLPRVARGNWSSGCILGAGGPSSLQLFQVLCQRCRVSALGPGVHRSASDLKSPVDQLQV